MKPHVRDAQRADIEYIARHMRAEDRAEAAAALAVTPRVALDHGFTYSKPCLTGVGDHGQPVLMFGVAPSGDPDVGWVWLLGTDELQEYAVRFARESRQWADRLNEHYRVLTNYADARNTVHLRWLRWCGFQFDGPPQPYGVAGLPFQRFVRIAPCARH